MYVTYEFVLGNYVVERVMRKVKNESEGNEWLEYYKETASAGGEKYHLRKALDGFTSGQKVTRKER